MWCVLFVFCCVTVCIVAADDADASDAFWAHPQTKPAPQLCNSKSAAATLSRTPSPDDVHHSGRKDTEKTKVRQVGSQLTKPVAAKPWRKQKTKKKLDTHHPSVSLTVAASSSLRLVDFFRLLFCCRISKRQSVCLSVYLFVCLFACQVSVLSSVCVCALLAKNCYFY